MEVGLDAAGARDTHECHTWFSSKSTLFAAGILRASVFCISYESLLLSLSAMKFSQQDQLHYPKPSILTYRELGACRVLSENDGAV